MTLLHKEKYYNVLDQQHFCCGESQFRYQCNECNEYMGCYFCEFDYNNPHDCDILD